MTWRSIFSINFSYVFYLWAVVYLVSHWHSNQTGLMYVPTRKFMQIILNTHHPVCNKFRSHTIQINGMIHCAGCTGLACGASISILLMCLYFVMPKRIPTFFFFSFIVIGLILIFSNFVQIIFHHKNAKLHLFSNILLVIGFFLIVSGMFQLTGRTIFGILGIMISFLWLDTRILLSKLQHTRLCKDCSNTCKIY